MIEAAGRQHTLPKEIGTCIIGGGIVGLCLAWFLAAEGIDVAVLDDEHHSGTNVNAGSLHVQMQSRFMRLFPDLVPAFERTLPLYPRAVRHWQGFAAVIGENIGLSISGGLMVAETDEQLAFLAVKCRREQALGLDVEIIGRDELRRIAPYLNPIMVGAEICRVEGKLDPLLANQAIRRKVRDLGVVHATETHVQRLSRDANEFVLQTDRGSLRTGRVVIAAGSGSRLLAASLGLMVPARAEPLHMNITEATAPLIGHLVQHADRQITMKQLAAGQVVIGGGWPAGLSGPDEHPTVMLDSMIGSLSLAQHVVPQVASLRVIRTWAGINTSVDGRAVLGPVSGVPGLFFAIPGDAGYTLGPLTARLAADAMMGRAPEVSIAEYSADRFA